MADAPARKGFSVSNPGGKEYLIVGGIALALALVYLYMKNRSSGAATSSTPATSSGTSTPTGMGANDLKIWIMDHASSPKKPAKKPAGESPVSPAK